MLKLFLYYLPTYKYLIFLTKESNLDKQCVFHNTFTNLKYKVFISSHYNFLKKILTMHGLSHPLNLNN